MRTFHTSRDIELDALSAMAEQWHPNFVERQGIRPRSQKRAEPAPRAGLHSHDRAMTGRGHRGGRQQPYR